MSQKKISVAIERVRKTNERSSKTSECSRKTSESSSKSSFTRGAPSTPGKKVSVSRHLLETDGHLHHRRESIGQLLTLPIELTRRRRSYSWQGHPIPEPKVEFEPTYRLEPSDKLPVADIKSMMKQEVEELIRDLEYSMLEAPSWAKVLTDRLKSETKSLLPSGNRYKVVVYVMITPKRRQSIQVSSRCLWETEYDSEINAEFQSKDIHVTASIYCVYSP